MTATEKKYRQYLGKLYFSTDRQSPVFIAGIFQDAYGQKLYRYNIVYLSKHVDQKERKLTCKRAMDRLKLRNWIPIDQYITSQPPVSSAK